MTKILNSYAAVFDYILENYKYSIQYETNMKIENIIEEMGQRGITSVDFYSKFEIHSDSRWLYWIGKLYFKTEEDLIEFKLRFL